MEFWLKLKPWSRNSSKISSLLSGLVLVGFGFFFWCKRNHVFIKLSEWCFLDIAESWEPLVCAFDFPTPLMVTLLFLWMFALVNKPAWNRHEEKNSWRQANFSKHWRTFTDHCRLLAWDILVAIQLTYKTGLVQVRTKADQEQPGQNSSVRFSEETITGGSPVWKWKLISDKEDNKACEKCDRVHSESMVRRQRQV